MGFTGWMDGGDISTGTIDYLVDKMGCVRMAEIDPDPFYILNFPGTMEVAALFRPYVQIKDGLIRRFAEAENSFYYSDEKNLVLFKGKEPNLRWREYAECIFEIVRRHDIRQAYFIGSVAGLVPHSREPRIFSSVSGESMLPLLQQHGLHPTYYEGPASFVTYLTREAPGHDLQLMTLVAEIPAYVQGRNVRSLFSVVRKLAVLLDMQLDLDDLRVAAKDFEKRISETVRERPELAEEIRKIERDYDRQIFGETSDDELKAWLEKQGIRLEQP